jgi:hypothetical protein
VEVVFGLLIDPLEDIGRLRSREQLILFFLLFLFPSFFSFFFFFASRKKKYSNRKSLQLVEQCCGVGQVC